MEPARQHFEKREVVLSKAALMEGVYTPMERVFVMKAFLEIAVRKNCKKVNLKQKSIWYTLYTHYQITIKFRTQSQFVSVFPRGVKSHCDIQGFEKT